MQRSSLRILALTVSVFTVLLLLPACTDETPTQESTSSAVNIWCDNTLSDFLNTTYSVIFPNKDIEVEIETFESASELDSALSDAESTGAYPDLFLFSQQNANLEKLMTDDVFLDCSTLLNGDSDYLSGVFNQTVMDVGRYEEEQLLIPIFYSVPIFLTTEERLQEYGLELQTPVTFDAFSALLQTYRDNYEENPDVRFVDGYYDSSVYLSMIGTSALDYRSMDSCLENAYIKEVLDIYATVLNDAEKTTNSDHNYAFNASSWCGYWYIAYASALSSGETPVFFSVPTVNDNTYAVPDIYAAISSHSTRQEEAYQLIQAMLSEEIQGSSGNGSNAGTATDITTTPVRINSIRTLMESASASIHTEIPEDVVEQYIKLLQNPQKVVLQSSGAARIITEMNPYFYGEASFDAALANAKDSIAAYMGT